MPLYSRRYFESDNCGREWFAFARREIMHQARDGEAVSAIVPALWTRIDREKLPDVAQSVQFDHNVLGERYCAEGFYGIMKLQNYRADYQRAVHRLAERIIAIGDQSVARADSDGQGMARTTSTRCPAHSAQPVRGGRRTSSRSRCWRTTPLRCRRAAQRLLRRNPPCLESVPAGLSRTAGRLCAGAGQEVPGLQTAGRGL